MKDDEFAAWFAARYLLLDVLPIDTCFLYFLCHHDCAPAVWPTGCCKIGRAHV